MQCECKTKVTHLPCKLPAKMINGRIRCWRHTKTCQTEKNSSQQKKSSQQRKSSQQKQPTFPKNKSQERKIVSQQKQPTFKLQESKNISQSKPQKTMEPKNRVYNMILTKRTFGGETHNYCLMGFERYSKTWVFLGGAQEPQDASKRQTAARELYEESSCVIDKRNDYDYWSHLAFYQTRYHTIFIHNQIPIEIYKLNAAAKKVYQNKNLPFDYKEMEKYQLVKLIDLLQMAWHPVRGNLYKHPKENLMKINGYVLKALSTADTELMHAYAF